MHGTGAGATPFRETFRRSPKLRIGAALLTLGLVACKSSPGGSNPASDPPSAGSTVVYAAIGASDVSGVGSSAPCFAFFLDCPERMGYVFVAARTPHRQGFPVTVTNLGISAAVISPGFQALGRQHGREIPGNFIEQEAPFVPRDATLVTIFAGPNDANTITAALGAGAGGADPAGYIDQQVRAFRSDYETLLADIRRRAPAAHIVALNVPNLASLPFLTRTTPLQRDAARRIAVGMSTTAINPLVSPRVTVVDLLCDPRMYEPATYSADGFHPSDAGYAVLAGEVVRAATSNAYPAPRSSCPQMNAP